MSAVAADLEARAADCREAAAEPGLSVSTASALLSNADSLMRRAAQLRTTPAPSITSSPRVIAPRAAIGSARPAAPVAPARPAPRFDHLSREAKIRLIAAGFEIPEGMADEAIARGQAVDAFALAAARWCEIERAARAILDA